MRILHPALSILLICQTPTDHPQNPVFHELITDGFTVNGTTVRLPAPTLRDAADAEASRDALRSVAGDDRAARELLRDSITAPFILKNRDVKAGDSIIRVVDVWFVVHSPLEEIDLDRSIRQADGQVVEAGNMRFETKVLDDKDLKSRKIESLSPGNGRKEWFTHLTGRLLDRIAVEATDRSVATRTEHSLLIATRTDPAFDKDERLPNQWASLIRKGTKEDKGPPQAHRGSASYVKLSKLEGEPGALLVEAHMVYVEPFDWFQGNPILKSKISVVAQDQIRRLRREIEKKRSKAR